MAFLLAGLTVAFLSSSNVSAKGKALFLPGGEGKMAGEGYTIMCEGCGTDPSAYCEGSFEDCWSFCESYCGGACAPCNRAAC